MGACIYEIDARWHYGGADPEGLLGQCRVFDLRTLDWLPQTLAAVRGRFAMRLPSDGWGVLQPDRQTLLDYRGMGLAAPLEAIKTLKEPDRYASTPPPSLEWHPAGVPQGTRLLVGTIMEKQGLLLPDGRQVVPFICDAIDPEDARFIRLRIGRQIVLLDRAGSLITPGGETTWAALGAPGFVPLQRVAPAAE